MLKIGFILGVLCGALTVSAIVASSASAGWFIEGEELAAGSKAPLTSAATVDTASTLLIPSLGIAVVCSGSTFNGVLPEIVGEEAKASSFDFLACNTTKPASGCALVTANQTIQTLAINATAKEATSPDGKLVVRAQTKNTLANVEFNEMNTCAFNGLEPIKGLLTLNAPALQEEQATQPIEGQGSTENNSLEIGGAKAFFSGGKTLFALASGKKWNLDAPAFRAENATNNNGIELTTVQETGKTIEFSLAAAGGWVKCASGVTFASQTVNLPRDVLDLKPTFPNNCEGNLPGELRVTATVSKCKIFEIRATRTFGFVEGCEFAIPVTGHPNCVIDVSAQGGLGTVTYTSLGTPKAIGVEIRATGAAYATNTQCGLANGNGELKANLVIEGIKPPGTMTKVSIEVK